MDIKKFSEDVKNYCKKAYDYSASKLKEGAEKTVYQINLTTLQSNVAKALSKQLKDKDTFIVAKEVKVNPAYEFIIVMDHKDNSNLVVITFNPMRSSMKDSHRTINVSHTNKNLHADIRIEDLSNTKLVCDAVEETVNKVLEFING